MLSSATMGERLDLGCYRVVLPFDAKRVCAIIMTHSPIDLTRLTPREREVYLLALDGLTNAEIGRRLKISPRTAEGHRQRIHRVLGLQRIASPTLRPRTAQASPSPIEAPDLSVLSARQRQVYELVVGEGMTSAAAAAHLQISTGTVEFPPRPHRGSTGRISSASDASARTGGSRGEAP